MKSIILHPTDTSQWHALVNEAQAASQIVLTENTESYLVFVLMRYTKGTRLMDSILALDFLHAMNHSGRLRLDQLIELGDKSLLFSGLFPGLAARRRVSIDYFIGIGQAAYLTASELHHESSAQLFYELGEHFHELQSILTAMRSVAKCIDSSNNNTLMTSELHWQ